LENRLEILDLDVQSSTRPRRLVALRTLEPAETPPVALDDPVFGAELGVGKGRLKRPAPQLAVEPWNASGVGVSISHHTIWAMPYSYLRAKHLAAASVPAVRICRRSLVT